MSKIILGTMRWILKFLGLSLRKLLYNIEKSLLNLTIEKFPYAVFSNF